MKARVRPALGEQVTARIVAFRALTTLVGEIAETFEFDRRTPVAARLAEVATSVSDAVGADRWWVGAFVADLPHTTSCGGALDAEQWETTLGASAAPVVVRCLDHDLLEWGIAVHMEGATLEGYEIEPVLQALMFSAIGAARSPLPVD